MRTLSAARMSGPRCGRRNGCRAASLSSVSRGRVTATRRTSLRPCSFRRDAQVRQRSEHVSAAAPYSDRSQPPHAHDLDAHEIAQALAKCDPPVLTSCIGRRAVLAEAVVTGRLAFEMAHSAAAVRKNSARGRSRKDGVMTTHDLKRTSMAHGCESDTSMHQPRAMSQLTLRTPNDALASRLSTRCRCFAVRIKIGSLERTIAAAEAPCGRSTNSLTTVPEGAA